MALGELVLLTVMCFSFFIAGYGLGYTKSEKNHSETIEYLSSLLRKKYGKDSTGLESSSEKRVF